MSVFLSISIALLSGLMFTRVFKAFGINFPDVTAFLIAGLLIGPCGMGRLGIEGVGFASYETVEAVNAINTAALGFIAFSIGSEFRLSDLEKTGKAATVIGIFQAVIASLLVDVVLVLLHFVLGDEVLPVEVAITLGAIASATAPAATLMVVCQYKADGPLTRLLLPIVALDDVVGLVVFSVSFGIAQAMEGGNMDMISIVVNPVLEIIFSVLLGSLLGFVMTRLEKMFYSNTNRLSMTISFVFLTIALSYLEIPVGPATISFSSLLVCMMLGTVFCKGFFYEPTLLTDCTHDMRIMREEIFGPALPVTTFKTRDEAIEKANDCVYGLTSSIYTQNTDVMMRALNEIHFGETYVNREHFEAFQGFHAGVRQSGIGGDDGERGLEEFLETHVCYVDYDTMAQG